jgi:hypothetical protein
MMYVSIYCFAKKCNVSKAMPVSYSIQFWITGHAADPHALQTAAEVNCQHARQVR